MIPHLAATRLVVFAAIALALAAESRADLVIKRAGDAAIWPAGTTVVPFERVSGLILFRGSLGSGSRRDTSGWLMLDTGAGSLALDHGLARALSLDPWPAGPGQVTATRRPLARFAVGGLSLEGISPVLAIDARPLSPRLDRPLMGLFAPAILEGTSVLVDYRREVWAAVPRGFMIRAPEGPRPSVAGGETAGQLDRISKSRSVHAMLLGPASVAVPFRLEGDDKILVSARIADPAPPDYSRPLTLVVDTGADACYFDRAAFLARVRTSSSWPWLNGLEVTTVYGKKRGSATALPSLELLGASGPTSCREIAAMVTDDTLLPGLQASVGQRVDGLLGYSYLQHFRLLVDYTNRVLWLDRAESPIDDEAPFGLTAAGVQLARIQGRLRVVGVANGTDAATLLALGDEVTSIDGSATARMSLAEAQRLLDGPEGTRVRVVVRREKAVYAVELTRRRLL